MRRLRFEETTRQSVSQDKTNFFADPSSLQGWLNDFSICRYAAYPESRGSRSCNYITVTTSWLHKPPVVLALEVRTIP